MKMAEFGQSVVEREKGKGKSAMTQGPAVVYHPFEILGRPPILAQSSASSSYAHYVEQYSRHLPKNLH